ncbi:MAG: hypothetical protein DRP92_00420 [Candidatus Neomarinimicrobiota bacterium]|nr:MAG: hypothetical protein DRP92_00420 [Candidatus Neomarinimicrobiota bacterium]
MSRKALIVVSIISLTFSLAFSDAKGERILKQVSSTVSAPKDMKAKLTIVLIDRKGNKKYRKAEMYAKEDEKRIIRFTEPADQRGIAFLSLPGDIQYLYMPAFKKVRRIAPHIKNTKFAGTDFTYEDLSTSKYDRDYSADLIRENETHWVLELTPKPGVKKSYSKMIMHVRKDNYYPDKVEFYDKNGTLTKVLENLKISRQKEYWYAEVALMKDLKENHSTKMILEEVSFDSNLSDKLFTRRQLIRWR